MSRSGPSGAKLPATIFCLVAFGLLSLGPSVAKPLATNLCPGAWGMLALGPVLVVLGPGLILVPGFVLVLFAIAWSLPAPGSLVLAIGSRLAGGSCLLMVLLWFSGMLMVSVARVCLFECLV